MHWGTTEPHRSHPWMISYLLLDNNTYTTPILPVSDVNTKNLQAPNAYHFNWIELAVKFRHKCICAPLLWSGSQVGMACSGNHLAGWGDEPCNSFGSQLDKLGNISPLAHADQWIHALPEQSGVLLVTHSSLSSPEVCHIVQHMGLTLEWLYHAASIVCHHQIFHLEGLQGIWWERCMCQWLVKDKQGLLVRVCSLKNVNFLFNLS